MIRDIAALADAIDPRKSHGAQFDAIQLTSSPLLIAASDALRSLTTALEIGRAMQRETDAKIADSRADANNPWREQSLSVDRHRMQTAKLTASDIAAAIRSTAHAVDLEGLTETVVLALAESHVEPRPNNSTKVSDWLTASDLRRAARAVLSSLGLHAREN